MRVRKLIVLLSLAMVPVLFGNFTSTVKAADPIKMTYANFFPPVHVQSKLAESWCQEVEKRTNGAVKIDYYPGGTLTKAPQTYEGVSLGIADIGMTVLAYTRGRFPVLGAVDLPMGYPNGVVATKVANAVLEQFKPEEFKDTQVMFLHAHGPGYIHTMKKPVKNLADMKGLKIRSTGMSTYLVNGLGGTPVGQGMSEAYTSLQKGVVDGSAHPLEANKGWKLGEVLKYCVAEDSVAYTTAMIVTMNKAKWAALSPEIQKTIMEINSEWTIKHGQAWDEIDVEGRKFFTEKGNEIITLDPKESAKWEEAVKPAIASYAQELNAKGFNGTEIIDFISKTIESSK
ncbi:MAG: TRAP transporter substrate-binding protein [Desulfamplus sp.]|nr:TRAP transporter substrate-binding protein [Desulfamplus sp.]MBF0259367.1 TRAP transporter substrate-binding protein [Desulfamplus sp.]